MARKRRSDSMITALEDFGAAVREVLEDITEEVYESVDRGLDAAMDEMRDKLADQTPVSPGGGTTKAAWETEGKYKNVRYIFNTHTTGHRDVKNPNARTYNMGEDGIPIVNLLEFGKKGKPFVRETVQREQENIINIIKGEIENGNT